MSQPSQRELFQRLNESLDALIACEKEEQEAILNRQTAHLPLICGKINHLVSEVEKLQAGLSSIWPGLALPPELEEHGRDCQKKLAVLQELGLQNHLLLESSLRFLGEVYREVFGSKKQPSVYNQMGILPSAISQSGVLLNTQA